VLSQKIAKAAEKAAAGDFDAFEELEATRDSIQKALDELSRGAPTGCPATTTSARCPPNCSACKATWKPIHESATSVIQRRGLVTDLADTAADFSQQVPQLQGRWTRWSAP
jgi:twitching motility protein PilJ